MPRLKPNQPCPLHRGRKDCCGRSRVNPLSQRQSRQYTIVETGVRRFPDGREVCSPAALARRKNYLLREQKYCIGCLKDFTDYRDVDLAHIVSKGMAGWKKDDRLSNLTLCHRVLNIACGSRNLLEFIKELRAAKKKFPCEGQC